MLNRRLLQVNLDDGAGNVSAHWLDFDMEKKTLSVSSFQTSLVR